MTDDMEFALDFSKVPLSRQSKNPTEKKTNPNMISFAFILCSTLLLTSAYPQKTSKPSTADVEDQDVYDVVIKKIMSKVMQDVFAGTSMLESLVNRTMEEVEKHDGDVAKIIPLQNGEGIDVVAAKVVRALLTKLGEKWALENTDDYLGKKKVDEYLGELALKADEYIRKRFGKKTAIKAEESE